MGKKFATVILMKGIRESIVTYYVDLAEEKRIVGEYNKLAKDMREFIIDYNEDNTYKFQNVELINN